MQLDLKTYHGRNNYVIHAVITFIIYVRAYFMHYIAMLLLLTLQMLLFTGWIQLQNAPKTVISNF